MKTITKDIRKAIICANVGSEIARFKVEGGVLTIGNLAYIENFDLWEQISIKKTPLQDIKDEDSTFIASILGFNKTLARFTVPASVRVGKRMILDLFSESPKDVTEPFKVIVVYNYLKDRGYAMPFQFTDKENTKINWISDIELFESKVYQKK